MSDAVPPFQRLLATLVGSAIVLFARLITAVRGIWAGVEPVPVQRLYYANHTSNGDFILIWTVLPPEMRARTRPVAGSDYWLASPLRTFIGRAVFNAVLIDRRREERTDNPLETILAAVDEGSSLIIFPEGGRNTGEDPLLPFKSGIYNISVARPDLELVPVWIENLNDVMPKGKVVPIPLLCTVTFGEPIRAEAGEDHKDFLDRAAEALLAIRPEVRS